MPEDSPLDDTRDLLDESAGMIAELAQVCERSVIFPGVPREMKRLTRHILQNQRSALDYLAYEMVQAFGRPGSKGSYPLTRSFNADARKQLPGLAAGRPDLLEMIAARQPDQAGYEWLSLLSERVIHVKHRSHSRPSQQRRTTYHVPLGGGARMTWDSGIRVGPGLIPAGAPVEIVEYVEWYLDDDLQLPVVRTLHMLQGKVTAVVKDFADLLGW